MMNADFDVAGGVSYRQRAFSPASQTNSGKSASSERKATSDTYKMVYQNAIKSGYAEIPYDPNAFYPSFTADNDPYFLTFNGENNGHHKALVIDVKKKRNQHKSILSLLYPDGTTDKLEANYRTNTETKKRSVSANVRRIKKAARAKR